MPFLYANSVFAHMLRCFDGSCVRLAVCQVADLWSSTLFTFAKSELVEDFGFCAVHDAHFIVGSAVTSIGIAGILVL
jgi:hypothetical protein